MLRLLPGSKVTDPVGNVVHDSAAGVAEYLETNAAHAGSLAGKEVWVSLFDGGWDWSDIDLIRKHFKSVGDARALPSIKAYLADFYDTLDPDSKEDWEENAWAPNGSADDFIGKVIKNNYFQFEVADDNLVLMVDLSASAPPVPPPIRAPAVVPSILGRSHATRLADNPATFLCGIWAPLNGHRPLIKLTVDTAASSVHIDSFFYKATPKAAAFARKIAQENGRTLGGLGMEWVKEVAKAYGAKTIDLYDAYVGSDGSTRSATLATTADAALAGASGSAALERLIERANRVLADDGADDAATRRAYMERVSRGGFYGQWGFVGDKTRGKDTTHVVDVASMEDLNAAFVDLATRSSDV